MKDSSESSIPPKFMHSYGVWILTGEGFEEEWKDIEEQINNLYNKKDNEEVIAASKVLVNFYHQPLVRWNENFYEGLIHLLRENFRILYVYSEREVPNFKESMTRKLKIDGLNDCLNQLKLEEMNKKNENLPFNFSVFAPLLSSRAWGYITLPGINLKYFGGRRYSPLKIENSEITEGKLDKKARNLLDRHLSLKEEDSRWKFVKNMLNPDKEEK